MSGNGWLRRAAGWLGLAAAAGMLVVLVMGATVTTTGSAQGCGRDWPLCNGRLVPDFALAAANFAGEWGDQMFVSADGGITWQRSAVITNWASIAC